MAKQFGVWGIDIGQCALKALRVEMVDGQPTATAFDYIEHPKILSQPDADPDALTREALEKFLSRNPLGKDHVAVGVSGQSGLARFVKLPPVEEKKVADIVKFEAKQQIPFPLDEVVWDFQRLSAKQEVVGGFAMETEIGLFAMKRDVISRVLGHYQSVRAEVHVVQMASLALCNYAAYEVLKKRGAADPAAEGTDDTPRGKKRCAVVLDIGTDSSNLLITDGVKIIWQRPVPLGGNNFTRALTKELKLTFAKAEHLKRNAAKSPELAAILKALRPVLTDFVGEVQRSLGYFTNTHRDAHVAFMVGLGSAFKLPGLQKYLQEKLSLDVRKPATIDGLSGEAVLADPVFTDNVLTFPVAYGLAMQGVALQLPPDEAAKYALLRTNLLPGEIRTERLIRAKKPWAAAAAACLLLGTGAVAFGIGTQYRAVTAAPVVQASETAKGAIGQADQRAKEVTDKQAKVDEGVKAVKAIVAGKDESLNWVRLNEVVAAALPRLVDEKDPADPNRVILPANLNPDLVGDNDRAKPPIYQGAYERAFQKRVERVRYGVPLEKLFDDTLTDQLLTVNVEAVDCRWTDTPQGFLDAAAQKAFADRAIYVTADLEPNEKEAADPSPFGSKGPKEKPKAPEGGVWVVEVRGFTYHAQGTDFVRRTLVRNLKRIDQFAKETDPDGKKVAKLVGGKPAAPAPATTQDGTPPMPPSATPPATAAAADVPDPVLSRVSHVFIGLDKSRDVAALNRPGKPVGFELIQSTTLNALVVPPAPTGDPSTVGGLPSAATSAGGPAGSGGSGGGSGWQSLLRGGGGSVAEFGGQGIGTGAPGGGGPGVSPDGKPNGPTKQLTEFIVYFFWREPTAAAEAPAVPK